MSEPRSRILIVDDEKDHADVMCEALAREGHDCDVANSLDEARRALKRRRYDVIVTDLRMEGEVAIQPEGSEQPFVYRGFQMVDEEKFRNLRGDELRKLNQNGALPLIMAHMFSLSVIREIFARQMRQGTGPASLRQPATAEA